MKDKLTGLSIHQQAATSRGGVQRQTGGEVYLMVEQRSQGLANSNQAVLPGDAYPQVSGLAPGTEVYSWFAITSNGIGSAPGGAMVSTPFCPVHPGSPEG